MGYTTPANMGGIGMLTFGDSSSGFTFVGSAETFPLVLSISIMIQGIGFAIAQSTGLSDLAIVGCTLTSQAMLPGMLGNSATVGGRVSLTMLAVLFIVPYIQLIFGLEVALRAFKSQPFQQRSKWNVAICVAIVFTLLLTTFLITHFLRPSNFCLAALFYFVGRWKQFCLAVVIGIAVTLLICSGIVFWKLQNSVKVDSTERVAASRMVYYLIVAVISLVCLAPALL